MDATREWFRRQKFRSLLAALIAVMVVYPIVGQFAATRLGLDLLRSALFAVAMGIVFDAKRQRALAFALGIPTLACAWGFAATDQPPRALDAAFHAFAAAFLGVTAYTILRAVYREKVISSDSVYGGFCIYLLVGVIFGHFYCLLETFAPGSFTIDGRLAGEMAGHDRGHFIFTYFSLITLTTVGYGDVTPTSAAARSLAAIEAIVGQFTIAVLVAELIGRRVSQSVEPRHSEDSSAP